jgi:hypothetical protein
VPGAVIAETVRDMTVLVASTRHKRRSLAEIARTEISSFAWLVARIAVLFILLITLAVAEECDEEESQSRRTVLGSAKTVSNPVRINPARRKQRKLVSRPVPVITHPPIFVH